MTGAAVRVSHWVRGKKQNGSSRLDKIGCCHGDGVVDNFFQTAQILLSTTPSPWQIKLSHEAYFFEMLLRCSVILGSTFLSSLNVSPTLLRIFA